LALMEFLGKCFTTWATPPAFFALVIFQVVSLLLTQCRCLTSILLSMAFCIARITGGCHPNQFIHCNEVLLTYCLDWPWIVILPMSASQVGGITGVIHSGPALNQLLIHLVAEVSIYSLLWGCLSTVNLD
jgi:hypothetical protein